MARRNLLQVSVDALPGIAFHRQARSGVLLNDSFARAQLVCLGLHDVMNSRVVLILKFMSGLKMTPLDVLARKIGMLLTPSLSRGTAYNLRK